MFIYENKISPPNISFGAQDHNSIIDLNQDLDGFKKFKKKYASIYDDYEMIRAFRVSKNIVTLKPNETKYFATKVNFPNYKMRYYEMENKKKYFLQISINNPLKFSKKYTEKILGNSEKKFSIFTGKITSNPIPLIYEVYNAK